MTRNNSIYNNLIELVGQTPMVQLNVITNTFPGKYFAKLEMFNHGQSQKDRIALHIIENACLLHPFVLVVFLKLLGIFILLDKSCIPY